VAACGARAAGGDAAYRLPIVWLTAEATADAKSKTIISSERRTASIVPDHAMILASRRESQVRTAPEQSLDPTPTDNKQIVQRVQ
jgi:hypothetical protein